VDPCTGLTVGLVLVLGHDGNVGGDDGLGALAGKLEALLLVARVLQKVLAMSFPVFVVWLDERCM
jgi:hypothetical protein